MSSNVCSICLEELTLTVQAACVPCGHTFCYTCITEWRKTSRACPKCRMDVTSVLRLYNDGDPSLPSAEHAELNQRAPSPFRHLGEFFQSLPARVSTLRSTTPRWVEEQLENARERFSRLKAVCRRTKARWQGLTVAQKNFALGAAFVVFLLLLIDFRQGDGIFHTFMAPVLRVVYTILYFPVYLVLYTLAYFAYLFFDFLASVLWLVFELVYGILWFFVYGIYTIIKSVILAIWYSLSWSASSIWGLFVGLWFFLTRLITALVYGGVVGAVVVGLHPPTYQRVKEWFRNVHRQIMERTRN